MTPAGYIAKRIHTSTDWLNNSAVQDIWSANNCVSQVCCDDIPHWQHNGYWLFDTPDTIRGLAAEEGIDLSGHRMFYYEIYAKQHNEDTDTREIFDLEPSLKTRVQVPATKKLDDFDVVSFSTDTAPECSPLSCNGLASSIAVNRRCLLDSFDEAQQLILNGVFKRSEPVPHRIFAAHTSSEQRLAGTTKHHPVSLRFSVSHAMEELSFCHLPVKLYAFALESGTTITQEHAPQ